MRCACAVVVAALVIALAGCGDDAPALIEGRPGGPYVMTLHSEPSVLQPGTPTRLTTRLSHRSNDAPVENLQVLHERVVHNFLVNLDFSSFAHIHHEDFATLTSADLSAAQLSFPYTFQSAGHYRLVSQFTHNDRSWTKHFDLTVGNPAPIDVAVDLTSEQRSGPYLARLSTSPQHVVAGFEVELVVALEKDNRPVTDLELILGSEVHVAIWRTDGKMFGHTHSYTPHMAMMLNAMHNREVSAAERARAMNDMMVKMMNAPAEHVFHGPQLPVHYVFPEPGIYVVYFQCAPGGVSQVFKFMLEVHSYTQGMQTDISSIVDVADH